MNLADVFTVLSLILGLMAVFTAFWLLTAGLFPRWTERWAARIGESPVKCIVVGLVVFIPLLVMGFNLSKLLPGPLGKLLGVIVVLSTVLLALAGASGLALRIGQGLRSENDEREPWRRVFRGGVVLALTLATIVMLPLVLGAGFGALLLGRSGRNSPPSGPDSAQP